VYIYIYIYREREREVNGNLYCGEVVERAKKVDAIMKNEMIDKKMPRHKKKMG